MNEILSYLFNNLAGQATWLDYLIIFCAEYLGWVLILGLAVYLYQKRVWSDMLRVFGSAGLAWLAAELIKFIFPSPRPFLVLENINQLIIHGGLDSFPSAHAAIFFALATGVWFLNKKLAVVFFSGAVLISLARVASGIHWPTDVLVGAGLGFVAALLLMRFKSICLNTAS